MRRVVALLVIALLLTAPAHADDRLRTETSFEPAFAVADHVTGDVDGDGRDEIVVVGRAGEVRSWGRDAEGSLTGPAGSLDLPEPQRTLLALVKLRSKDAGRTLLALGPSGLLGYPPATGGAPAPRAVTLSKDARFRLRVGAPRFAPIARDVNGDGRVDVIVPTGKACEVWLQGDTADGAPSFSRVATVAVDLRRVTQTRTELLTDVLESAFHVPDLRFEDVNADGRADLVVADDKIRAYYLQRDDGSIPPEPDARVDLSQFRDTTPAGDVRLGRTLAGGDRQTMDSRDLNGDGIPDHVIAHRRKVWVFHGTGAGPQFTEPAAVLKVADDVSAVLLARIDDDDRPDLVLVRVQVPSAAGLLRGLLAEWSVEIGAVGYANAGDEGFSRTPAWRGELSVALPAILGMLRDPEALIRRFETATSTFRTTLSGDLDANGAPDLVLVSRGGEDAPAGSAEAWLDVASADDAGDLERVLGAVLFGGEQTDWTLDDVLEWVSELGARSASTATGGRQPDARVTLRARERFRQEDARAARLDGERTEIVLRYRDLTGGVTVFDVLRLR